MVERCAGAHPASQADEARGQVEPEILGHACLLALPVPGVQRDPVFSQSSAFKAVSRAQLKQHLQIQSVTAYLDIYNIPTRNETSMTQQTVVEALHSVSRDLAAINLSKQRRCK